MWSDLEIPFDRVTYRDGQLLTAQDLRDDKRRIDRLRWLHNRYLHDTWGIALGFEVKKPDSEGKAVVVGPGFAMDDSGRELLLAEGLHLTVPDVKGPQKFVLTLSYQEDAAFRDRSDLAALCVGGGLDPGIERPQITWRQPEDVRFGPQVPLVQVKVVDRAIQGELDSRVRRNARPLVRPHIGWGTTEAGRTGWRIWQEGEQENLGLEAVVDTSEAGFSHTPFYFAVLHGDFSNPALEPPLSPTDLWPAGSKPTFSPDAISFITGATKESFKYHVIAVKGLPSDEFVGSTKAEERGWSISWLGIEPVTGCEPKLDLGRIFFLSGFISEILARR
jgi:hypothetical protein